MTARRFAPIAGGFFVVVGLLGFVPDAVHSPAAGAPPLAMESGYGYLLGVFPVNTVHNVVHVVLGGWGFVAARALPPARTYARGLTWIYAGLAVMGLVPGFRTLFGLTPLFGHDVWLHALTAALAAWAGYGEAVRAIELREEGDRERVRL
jgi:Domain of unknown function (DUF4383)